MFMASKKQNACKYEQKYQIFYFKQSNLRDNTMY